MADAVVDEPEALARLDEKRPGVAAHGPNSV